jgi:hypothetical protein
MGRAAFVNPMAYPLLIERLKQAVAEVLRKTKA